MPERSSKTQGETNIMVRPMNGLGRLLGSEVIEVTSALSRKSWGDPELLPYENRPSTSDGFSVRAGASVTALGNDARREFVCAALSGFPAERFSDGQVEWISGANAGTKSSVLAFDASLGALVLDEGTSSPITAGDGLLARIKAPQTLEEWILFWGDGFGFPGEPSIPSRDTAGRSA